jgi:hypothetical protein
MPKLKSKCESLVRRQTYIRCQSRKNTAPYSFAYLTVNM